MAESKTKARVNRTPGPASDEGSGEAIEPRKAGGILPSEAEIVKALGIPVGFFDVESEPGEVMAGILAEIAAAGSVEEALALGVAEGLDDYGPGGPFAGKVLRFLDFKYQPSEFDPEGWPFVVIRAVDSDGVPHVLTSGAKQVVVIMAMARKQAEAGKGGLPFEAKVDVKAFRTSEGELRSATKLIAP